MSPMLFRRHRTDSRQDAWSEFAARLELENAAAAAERMRRWLDLDDVELDPVYALRREGQPALYLFEYVRERTGPTGSFAQQVANCLLRADEPFAPLAFRAHPRRNKVMESLEASRTGSTRIELPAPYDGPLSVFARDPEAASAMLSDPLYKLLERAVVERGAESVVVGERHILATLSAETPEGADRSLADRLEALASLATDLLALYALLNASRRGG